MLLRFFKVYVKIFSNINEGLILAVSLAKILANTKLPGWYEIFLKTLNRLEILDLSLVSSSYLF